MLPTVCAPGVITNKTRLQSMVHHRKYRLLIYPKLLQSLKLLCPMVLEEMHLQESTLFDLDVRSMTNTKRCPVSSSYDLCTCKVGSCYVERFRGKCIYKKYLSWLHPRSHEALSSTPCGLCTCLKLLQPVVKEMHLQENTLFDLDSKVKVSRDVTQYPRHHVTYAPAKFDVATSHV